MQSPSIAPSETTTALPPPLVAPLRSVTAALGGFVAAVVIAAMSVGLALDAALSLDVRLVVATLGLLLTAAFLVTSVQLGRRRGGLYYEPQGRGVGIGLTSADDLYWLPTAAFDGIAVRFYDRQLAQGSERVWSAELICSDRPSVVLVEADEREVVDRVVQALSDDSHGTPGFPVADEAAHITSGRDSDDANQPGLVAGTVVHAGVRRRFALGGIFWLFGGSLLAVGAALLMQLQASPMMAIFVAPVLLLFGGVTLGIAMAKRFAGEELIVVGDRLLHRWRFGKHTWAERAIDGRAVAWRLRVQALKGAYLEALGSDGSLAIGSGATTHSQLGIDGLNRVVLRLNAKPPSPQPPTQR